MSRQGRAVAAITAVFGLTGLGVGVLAYVATDWATTLFLVRAQGETAVRFGPVFVALVSFLVATLALLAGPVLAAVLGILFGSKHRDVTTAATTTGAGSLVGFLVMGLLVLPGVLLGVGAGASAPFGVGGYVVRLAIGAVPTAVVGAVAGAIGVRLAD